MTNYNLEEFRTWMEEKGKASLIDWDYYIQKWDDWTKEEPLTTNYLEPETKELLLEWKAQVDQREKIREEWVQESKERERRERKRIERESKTLKLKYCEFCKEERAIFMGNFCFACQPPSPGGLLDNLEWQATDFAKQQSKITELETELQTEREVNQEALEISRVWHERQKAELKEQHAQTNQAQQTKINELERSLQDLQQENQTLKDQTEAKKQRILALEADKSDLISQLSQTKQEFQELQEHLTQEKFSLHQESPSSRRF